jgi:hypothetical protein
VETGTSLQVTANNETIFTHNQVWFELNQKYSEWGFLQNPLSNSMTVFLALYTNYCANMKEQLYRIFDGLRREYDPTANYSMVEMGIDGHKQSKRTNTDNTDNVMGTKVSDFDVEKQGSESLARTYGRKETTEVFDNAFTSGISATGTKNEKRETEYATPTDTTTYTGRKDSTKQGTEKTQTITSGTETLTASGQNASAGHSRNNRSEEFDNNVTVNGSVIDSTGKRTAETMTGLTDGAQHMFSRFGNIGVATAADMLAKEYELRKINLLKDWVHGFILEYCTYVGSGE